MTGSRPRDTLPPDLDQVIAEVAARHGLDASAIPDAVVVAGVGLLHEAMPLLKRSGFEDHARWLPVLAYAFVEWARRDHRADLGPRPSPSQRPPSTTD